MNEAAVDCACTHILHHYCRDVIKAGDQDSFQRWSFSNPSILVLSRDSIFLKNLMKQNCSHCVSPHICVCVYVCMYIYACMFTQSLDSVLQHYLPEVEDQFYPQCVFTKNINNSKKNSDVRKKHLDRLKPKGQ